MHCLLYSKISTLKELVYTYASTNYRVFAIFLVVSILLAVVGYLTAFMIYRLSVIACGLLVFRPFERKT